MKYLFSVLPSCDTSISSEPPAGISLPSPSQAVSSSTARLRAPLKTGGKSYFQRTKVTTDAAHKKTHYIV
ncbi:MAG TPA: hypothetical protein VIK14_03405 [Ignavibacteria bacterium]